MKRAGNLLDMIACTENLHLAFIKARKSKQGQSAVLAFEKDLDSNLLMLQNQLIVNNVEVGNYHYFTITDPKVRQICAAPFCERVLHHALMNVCHPWFERHLISDTYATRKNKGTYSALDRAKNCARTFSHYVKMDIRKYFDNIDHAILKKQLDGLFKDTALQTVFGQIIDSYHVGDEEKGVPIGNLTSQYFANHYLSAADHFAKEILMVYGYIRYMDDMLFFGDSKEDLQQKTKLFVCFVEQTLGLSFKPIVYGTTNKGVAFLGYKTYPYHVKLNKRSKIRFKTKMAQCEENLESGKWNQYEYQQHVIPLLAFVQYADTVDLRKKTINFETG